MTRNNRHRPTWISLNSVICIRANRNVSIASRSRWWLQSARSRLQLDFLSIPIALITTSHRHCESITRKFPCDWNGRQREFFKIMIEKVTHRERKKEEIRSIEMQTIRKSSKGSQLDGRVLKSILIRDLKATNFYSPLGYGPTCHVIFVFRLFTQG